MKSHGIDRNFSDETLNIDLIMRCSLNALDHGSIEEGIGMTKRVGRTGPSPMRNTITRRSSPFWEHFVRNGKLRISSLRDGGLIEEKEGAGLEGARWRYQP